LEKIAESASTVGRRPSVGALGFWVLACTGLGLFALSVLSTAYVERRAARRQVTIEEARKRQIEQYNADLAVVRDGLRANPKYLARQIRDNLGYARAGDEPLPFASDRRVLRPEALVVDPEVETPMSQLCAAFAQPVLRRLGLTAGLMLLATAFVIFDIPTKDVDAGCRAGVQRL